MNQPQWPSGLPELETPQLRLRKLTQEDVTDIFDYGSDPAVARYLRFVEHKSLADSQEFLSILMDLCKNNTDFIWGIELKETAHLIGNCRLICNLTHRRGEIGYVLTQRYWGRGFAAEAVAAVVKFAFTQTDMNRIEGHCIVENTPSSRVLEKCGFQCEGILREYEFLKGRFVDVRVHSILKSEYRPG